MKVFGSNPDIYLTWLEKAIEKLGGSISYGVAITSLTSLAGDYDIIINACGMGAREVAGDDKMVSIKGQVIQTLDKYNKVTLIIFCEILAE